MFFSLQRLKEAKVSEHIKDFFTAKFFLFHRKGTETLRFF